MRNQIREQKERKKLIQIAPPRFDSKKPFRKFVASKKVVFIFGSVPSIPSSHYVYLAKDQRIALYYNYMCSLCKKMQ